MPWTSDSLPWDTKWTKPPRPSGPFEAINYFPGNPILNRGKGSSSLLRQLIKVLPGNPVLLRGRGSSSLARQMARNLSGPPAVLAGGLGATLSAIQYNAPSVLSGGLGSQLSVAGNFPGNPTLVGAQAIAPIIAAKLARFTGHTT
jgi:hypothetical protein